MRQVNTEAPWTATSVKAARPDPLLAALIAANNLIADPRRWCKGRLETDKRERLCALGAIHYSTPIDGHLFADSIEYLDSAQETNFTMDAVLLAEWQDAPERTHTEVMAVFAKAIDMRRQELGIPLTVPHPSDVGI